ncbi:hypothetical protein HPB47_017073, partial [Ixodes persulcatus]
MSATNPNAMDHCEVFFEVVDESPDSPAQDPLSSSSSIPFDRVTGVTILDFLRRQGLREEGILRVSGSAVKMDVCERHFSDDDILREVSHVDEVTGRTVTAPLSRVRLRPGAVPSKFPGCPDYLSKHHARREDPDSKRLRQEASAMERALAESIDSFRNEEEADRILSIKDLSDHLKNVKSAFWHAIEGNGHLTLVHIVETEAPWIKYSIVVKPDLTLTLLLVIAGYRGGLLYPAMTAVNAVAHNYVVVEEMSKRVDFLTMSNQRQLVTELTLDLLIDEDCSDFDALRAELEACYSKSPELLASVLDRSRRWPLHEASRPCSRSLTLPARAGVPTLLLQLKALNLLVLVLPEPNRDTLLALVHFLADVVELAPRNRMSLHNVAMVLAPNLFSPKRRKATEENLQVARTTTTLTRMLVWYRQILWT